jgi:hypothetical protein
MATAGEPLSINWDRKRGIFSYRFIADKAIAAPTVIYLPAERFGAEPSVELHTLSAAGVPRWEYQHEQQRLLIFNEGCSGEVEAFIQASTLPRDP